jgi:hypothetical protein
MMSTDEAGTEVRFRTDQPDGKRFWRFVNFRRVMCPAGHHIKHDFDFNEVGFIPCRHWMGDEKRECGRWIFLFAIRGGGIIEVEVWDMADKDKIKELSTPAQMIEYLGIFAGDRPQPSPHVSAPRPPARPSDRHHR